MSSSGEWDSRFPEVDQGDLQDPVAPDQSYEREQGARPRLRLGDAERIAMDRMAHAERGEAPLPPVPPEAPAPGEAMGAGFGDNDVTNRLIAALNGDEEPLDFPELYDQSLTNSQPVQPRPVQPQPPQPQAFPPFPGVQAGAVAQSLLRAPGQFRPAPQQAAPIPFPSQAVARPMPMGGPTRAPVAQPQPAMRPMGPVGRAPVAPMRRAAMPAHGLRLREASAPGPVAPPISRAQSLYELLNRSRHAPRPMRRATPVQEPSLAPSFDAFSGGSVESDRPVAQEVQDAINVILHSLPQGANENRPEEEERAEALRRVRLLRAQLVGLQNKIEQTGNEEMPQAASPMNAQPEAPMQPAPGANMFAPAEPQAPMAGEPYRPFAGAMPEQSANALDHPIVGQQMMREPAQGGYEQSAGNNPFAQQPYEGQYGQQPHAAQPYGAPAGAEHMAQAQADSWTDPSWEDEAGMMEDDELPPGVYDDDLPKGIVPNARDDSKSRSSLFGGTAAGIAGGMAIAACIGGAAMFFSGNTDFLDNFADRMKVASNESTAPQSVRSAPATLDLSPAQKTTPVSAALSQPSGRTDGKLTLVVQDAAGSADGPITLEVSLKDGDPAATIIRIKGVPPGASLSGGFNVGDGTWLVAQDKLNALQLNVPSYFSGKFELKAQVLASDAVTPVSEVSAFTVQIGDSASSQVADNGSAIGRRDETEVTSSTVNQTVPTASSEGVAVPVTKKSVTNVAALSSDTEKAKAPKSDDPILKIVQDGHALLEQRDFAGARKLYKKAADLGSPEGALALGRSYDPVYFKENNLSSSSADTKQALIWYQEALSRGNDGARAMVDRLLKWVQKGS